MNKTFSKIKKHIKVLNEETTYSGRSVYSVSGWDGLAKIILWIVIPLFILISVYFKWGVRTDLIIGVVILICLLPSIMKLIK